MVNHQYMVKQLTRFICSSSHAFKHAGRSPDVPIIWSVQPPSDQSSAHIMNIHFIPEVNSAAADGNCPAVALSGCNVPSKLLGLSNRQEEEARV